MRFPPLAQNGTAGGSLCPWPDPNHRLRVLKVARCPWPYPNHRLRQTVQGRGGVGNWGVGGGGRAKGDFQNKNQTSARVLTEAKGDFQNKTQNSARVFTGAMVISNPRQQN